MVLLTARTAHACRRIASATSSLGAPSPGRGLERATGWPPDSPFSAGTCSFAHFAALGFGAARRKASATVTDPKQIGTGTQPVAYLGIHGIADGTLGISGGRTMRDRFVVNHGCVPQDPPEAGAGSGTHVCTTYQGCDPGYPVGWCSFDGGHTPGRRSTHALYPRNVGAH